MLLDLAISPYKFGNIYMIFFTDVPFQLFFT